MQADTNDIIQAGIHQLQETFAALYTGLTGNLICVRPMCTQLTCILLSFVWLLH